MLVVTELENGVFVLTESETAGEHAAKCAKSVTIPKDKIVRIVVAESFAVVKTMMSN